jgi:hypothetical protein
MVKLRRAQVVFGVSVALVVALVTSAAAQSSASAGKAAPAKTSDKPWTAPKTPWGDPDLQGTWTTDSAFGIPLQRPQQFAGRAELNDEEFAQKVERDTRTRSNAESAVGSFRGDGAWLTKSFRQTSLIVEPADGTLPPLTPEAERKRQLAPRGTYGDGPFDGPEDFTMYDRCLTLGVVGSMTPKIYGNGHRIVQGPGYVAIMNEMIHEARVIPLDGRPHAGKSLQMYMGDGRGHWDGQTLVVETTNLNGKTGYSDVEAKLVERITRVEPDVLRYEVTVDAPRTYTRPVKISIPLTSPPGYQVLPYECHEGNRALMQALSGARAEDKALEEDLKNGVVRARKPVQNGLTVGGTRVGEPGPGGAATAPPPAPPATTTAPTGR